ncbi:MAG: hypothetical protein HY653_08060 [Acidobacteria bacterium]|nr:hypothetical protein [Acidobacteriota bacterium]
MFGTRIRIEKDLYEKVKNCAEAAGYSSVEEFVTHVLERETARILSGDSDPESEEALRKRLQGLGYIE